MLRQLLWLDENVFRSQLLWHFIFLLLGLLASVEKELKSLRAKTVKTPPAIGLCSSCKHLNWRVKKEEKSLTDKIIITHIFVHKNAVRLINHKQIILYWCVPAKEVRKNLWLCCCRSELHSYAFANIVSLLGASSLYIIYDQYEWLSWVYYMQDFTTVRVAIDIIEAL